MPSNAHEIPIAMIHTRPSLAATLLGDSAVDYDEVVMASNDLSECPSTEYRADAVALLKRDGKIAQAVVVEIQQSEDKNKRFSWPAYVTNLRAQMRCPADVLVLCPTDTIAKWSRQPITFTNSGSLMFPIAIGPIDMPQVVDPAEAAANPELATFSAISHGGRGRFGAQVLQTWLESLRNLDDDRIRLYFDYASSVMSEIAREHLEALMMTGTYEYQSDFAKKYYGDGIAAGEARGEARGEASAVLTVLAARGIAVSDEVAAKILSCTDLDRLTTWVRRAVTVTKAEELFLD